MLRKEFEEDDPYALVGQGFPCPDGYDSVGEMARCFVEEYALLGFDPERVLRLFRNPWFRGPNGVYRARGEAFVADLVNEVFGGVEGGAGANAQSL
ncbi:MAG: hypothetical protein KIS66_14540 [Fimbriimonadaceae bacterium]|nr:hypothetical protein [Fimbriimonadaceae bacterium]